MIVKDKISVKALHDCIRSDDMLFIYFIIIFIWKTERQNKIFLLLVHSSDDMPRLSKTILISNSRNSVLVSQVGGWDSNMQEVGIISVVGLINALLLFFLLK